MATTPGPPNINTLPLSKNQTLQFQWRPPTSDGGSPILGYLFRVNDADAGTMLPPTARYYSTGPTLSNGVTYPAFIHASNAIGLGAPAYFRPFQPGTTPPNPPSTINVQNNLTTTAVVTWTPPATAPDSTIFWYVLKVRPTDNSEPERSFTANGLTQTNYLVPGLTSDKEYLFQLQAQNCPGRSAPLQFSTIITTLDYFEPTDLASLQAWYDGSDPLGTGTAPADGTSIATWVDKSIWKRNATQSNATNQPLYNATCNAVKFDGINDFMLMSVPFLSNHSVFLTATPSLTSNYYFSRSNAIAVFYSPTMAQRFAGSNSLEYYNGTQRVNYTLTPTSIIQANYKYLQGVSINGNYNGSNVFNIAQSQSNTSDPYDWIGGQWSGDYTNSFYHDLIFYAGNMPNYYIQQVEGYIAWKTGTQSNLPADHPYRSTRPLNPGLISPYSSPNLSFWLDATRISTISSGTALTNWNDVSSNNYTGFASNGPVYQSSVFNGYMPAVTFNGSNQFINYGSNAMNLGLSSMSIFAVVSPNNTANGTYISKSYEAAGSNRWFMINDSGNVFLSIEGNAGGSTTIPATTGPQILNMAWTRQQLNIFKNGTFCNSTPLGDTSFSFGGTTQLVVGAYPNATGGLNPPAGYYYNGSIGEMIGFTSSPSINLRQKIEGYLSWKWGLTQNLPGNHPYKFYPPLSNYSSIAINTSTLFATNFNNGNDIGFTNFSNTRLVSSAGTTITGTGAAYNCVYSGSTNVYPSKSFTTITTNNVTWCASVYRTASGADYAGIIISRTGCNGSISPTVGISLFTNNTNRLSYSWSVGSTAYDTGAAGFIPLCNWTHVAVAVSPTETRFYINGSNIATRINNEPALSLNEMTIGNDLILPTTRFFPGYIDNVRFYTSTLTSNEIQAIYYNTQFI